MAKQVKVDRTDKSKSTKTVHPSESRIVTRSPKINFYFAVALGLIYLLLFDQNATGALIYGAGAFLFFNTVDYCILYYRLKKKGML